MQSLELRKYGLDDDQVSQLQEAINSAFRKFVLPQISRGRIIENVVFSGAPVTLDHKLNRPWTGYLLISMTSYMQLKHVINATPSKTITLEASAAGTASIYIF